MKFVKTHTHVSNSTCALENVVGCSTLLSRDIDLHSN